MATAKPFDSMTILNLNINPKWPKHHATPKCITNALRLRNRSSSGCGCGYECGCGCAPKRENQSESALVYMLGGSCSENRESVRQCSFPCSVVRKSVRDCSLPCSVSRMQKSEIQSGDVFFHARWFVTRRARISLEVLEYLKY